MTVTITGMKRRLRKFKKTCEIDRGNGTSKDKDEVNRRDVSECDG